MKAGDLVIILYERTRYYIIVQALGKEFPGEEESPVRKYLDNQNYRDAVGAQKTG